MAVPKALAWINERRMELGEPPLETIPSNLRDCFPSRLAPKLRTSGGIVHFVVVLDGETLQSPLPKGFEKDFEAAVKGVADPDADPMEARLLEWVNEQHLLGGFPPVEELVVPDGSRPVSVRTIVASMPKGTRCTVTWHQGRAILQGVRGEAKFTVPLPNDLNNALRPR